LSKRRILRKTISNFEGLKNTTMARKTISVYKRGDDWVAKKPENERPSAVKDTQKEAYLAAKRIALNEGRSITVYYTSGQKKVITPKVNDNDDCFITTACVKYYNLHDNCHELETLRKFRDTIMKPNSDYLPLVELYYQIAPLIVESINKNPNKPQIYKSIYAKIKKACTLIEENKTEEAINLYASIINTYATKYHS
jgi:Uncharacterized protein conserved in bacteria (DUF2188)